jgi:hypothetical protein
VPRGRAIRSGGTIHTLRYCPFTREQHPRGGPYAIQFADGGLFFCCERSIHGPLRRWHSPDGVTIRTS